MICRPHPGIFTMGLGIRGGGERGARAAYHGLQPDAAVRLKAQAEGKGSAHTQDGIDQTGEIADWRS